MKKKSIYRPGLNGIRAIAALISYVKFESKFLKIKHKKYTIVKSTSSKKSVEE